MTSQPKTSLRRILATVFLTVGGCYLIACVLLAVTQRRFIYLPPSFSSPVLDQMGKKADLVRWQNAAGQNIGWKRCSTVQPAHGQLLITYGNGSYAVGVHHYADAVRSSGWDVYILEYPGYADRPGSPSQTSFFAAADEALATLPTNCPTYLLGESLGTGVAAYLAGTHPQQVEGVALMAPYNQLVDVAQFHRPLFPVKYLLMDRFNSASYLQHYHGPVAIFTGTADRVVPDKFGLRLFVSYEGPKKLWEFQGDGHGEVFGRFDEKWPEIEAFWQKVPPLVRPVAAAVNR